MQGSVCIGTGTVPNQCRHFSSDQCSKEITWIQEDKIQYRNMVIVNKQIFPMNEVYWLTIYVRGVLDLFPMIQKVLPLNL